MMIGAGKYGRLVRIERRVVAIDPEYGTQTESWEPLGAAISRVNIQDVLPSRGENQYNGIDIAMRPARVRMRWRTDIDSSMRVVYLDRGNRIMEIISQPAEIGTREAIEFMVQEYSTRGNL